MPPSLSAHEVCYRTMTSGDGRMSPLELFHPNGAVDGVRVEGGAVPGMPLPDDVHDGGRLDLLVLTPSRQQLRSRHWLDDVLARAVPQLAPDAIVYILVPRLRRSWARRALERDGLRVSMTIAHVPSSQSTRYLVSLDRSAAMFAFDSVVAVWPRRRRVLVRALRFTGSTRVLEPMFPSLALLAQPPGARPPGSWLSCVTGEGHNAAVVVTSGRAGDDRLVALSALSGRESGQVVAKVRHRGSPELARESVNLAELGPRARAAGVRVPEPLDAREALPARSVLVQTALPGQSAAALLSSRPGALRSVLEPLTDWLEAWNRASVVLRVPAPGQLEQTLLPIAGRLAGELEDGTAYVEWLAGLCQRVAETRVPFVAAHNDLTMFNVLVDARRLGVVDWEAATDQQLPLTDFVYATADAAAAANRYASRVGAVEACFLPAGREAAVVTPLLRRLMSTVGVSPDVAELSFHSCWLQHAANEGRIAERRSDRPFLAIVERVAARRGSWSAIFRP